MRAFLLYIFLFFGCGYSAVLANDGRGALKDLNDAAFLAYESGSDSALVFA